MSRAGALRCAKEDSLVISTMTFLREITSRTAVGE